MKITSEAYFVEMFSTSSICLGHGEEMAVLLKH